MYWGSVSTISFIICMLKYLAGAVAICFVAHAVSAAEVSWQQIGRYFVVLMATINLVNIAAKTITFFCKNLAKDIDEEINEEDEEKRTEVW